MTHIELGILCAEVDKYIYFRGRKKKSRIAQFLSRILVTPLSVIKARMMPLQHI